jgi:hypothetical protein
MATWKTTGILIKIILKQIIREYGGKLWSGFIWYRAETSGGLW